MPTSFKRSVVAVLAATFSFACACSQTPKPATGAASGGENLDQVVATWGTNKLTLRQVDADLGEQLEELEKKKFQARRQQIERNVIESIIDAEAKKKGQTQEQYLKEQLEDKAKEPTEEEIQAYFAQNQAQMPPGSTLDTMRAQLVGFLKQQSQREIATKLFEQLKKDANAQITFKEPPKPRKTVEAKGPTRGPADAKVTIVEFSDFQCPFCSRAHDTVEEVMKLYAGKVKLTFRHFPLAFHQQAPKAAEASLCAGEQQKFWEYHDALFANQAKLMPEDLKEAAKTLGLDAAKFAECLDSGKMKKTVDEDMEAAKKVGVSGTPAFFINGVMLSGAQPVEAFKEVIDAELAAK